MRGVCDVYDVCTACMIGIMYMLCMMYMMCIMCTVGIDNSRQKITKKYRCVDL